MNSKYSDKEILLIHTFHPYAAYVEAATEAGYTPAPAGTYSSYRSIGTATASVGAALAPSELPEWDEQTPIAQYMSAVIALMDAEERLYTGPEIFHTTLGETSWVGILVTGDWHVGGTIAYRRLIDDLEVMRDTPGLYTIISGDLIDNYQQAKGLQHAMAETIAPRTARELAMLTHLMETYGPEEYLLIVAGNHDQFGDSDYLKFMAEQYGALYAGESGCSLHVHLGEQEYVLYVKHEMRGGRKDGFNLLNTFPDRVQADATFVGHLHDPELHVHQVKGQPVSHHRNGTYKLVDDYATRRGYTPAYGPSLVLLNPHEHEVIRFPSESWRHGVRYLQFLRDTKTIYGD